MVKVKRVMIVFLNLHFNLCRAVIKIVNKLQKLRPYQVTDIVLLRIKVLIRTRSKFNVSNINIAF